MKALPGFIGCISFALTYGWRLASPPLIGIGPQPVVPTTGTAPLPTKATAKRSQPESLETVLRRALAAPTGSAQRASAMAVVEQWLDADPWKACQVLAALPPSTERNQALFRALTKAAAQDSFRAWTDYAALSAALATVSDDPILAAMVKADPQRAWKLLTQDDHVLDTRTVGMIGRVWAERSGTEAAEFGNRLALPSARKDFLTGVFRSWIEQDITSCRRWFDQQPDRELLSSWINPYMFSSWTEGERPPQMTSEHLDFFASLPLPASNSGEHPMQSFLDRAWWQSDLRAQAREWIEKQADPELRSAAWSALLRHLPLDEMIASLGGDYTMRDQKSALNSAVSKGAWGNAEATMAALANIRDPELRGYAEQRLLEVWAQVDPQRALLELRKRASSMSEDDLRNLAQRWSSGEGTREVFALLESLPQQDAAKAAMVELASNWIGSRPAEVTRWLRTAAPSPARDAVALRAVDGLPFGHPSEAMALAQSIAEPQSREKATQLAFKRWLNTNADEAKKWLSTDAARHVPHALLLSMRNLAGNTLPSTNLTGTTGAMRTIRGMTLKVIW